MDYSEFSREMLIDRVRDLEMLNHELLKERDQETKLMQLYRERFL